MHFFYSLDGCFSRTIDTLVHRRPKNLNHLIGDASVSECFSYGTQRSILIWGMESSEEKRSHATSDASSQVELDRDASQRITLEATILPEVDDFRLAGKPLTKGAQRSTYAKQK